MQRIRVSIEVDTACALTKSLLNGPGPQDRVSHFACAITDRSSPPCAKALKVPKTSARCR